MTTIFVLALALIHGDKEHKKYSRLIFVGLVFCLVGDVCLLDSEQFIWGLASFLVSHVLFSEAFRSFEGIKMNFKLLGVLVIIGALIFLYLYDDLGEFLVPAAVYMVAIIYMSWTGINLASSKVYHRARYIPLAAVLFLLSDTVIAIERFKSASHLFGIVILLTYWASITLISESITKQEKVSSEEGKLVET